MAKASAPPTSLEPAAKFALNVAEETVTVWAHRRPLGLHEATWERVEEYSIEGGIELTGEGTLIRRGEAVWFLVDDYEDVHIFGNETGPDSNHDIP